MLKTKIKGLKTKIGEIRADVSTQVAAAKEKANAGDIAAAKEIKEKIDALKAEVSTLENELETLEALDSMDEEEERGEERGMSKKKNIIKPNSQETEGFERFIRTKGTETRDLDTSSGAVFVPKNVVNEVLELKEHDVDLSALATNQPVSSKSGSFPVAKRNAGVLLTKAELAEIADLDEEMFIDVEYSIETRAGKIALSNELIDDAAVDVVGYVKKQLRRIVKNTNNANVIAKLKTFKKVAAASIDDLKKIHNVELDPALEKTIVTNQDGYNHLDTLKDTDGRYLLQNDLTAPSGKSLFGAPIHVVSNKVLPNAGTVAKPLYPIFMGDMIEAVAIFTRAQIEVQWEKFDTYSQGLAIVLRNDYQQVDPDAARYIEFNPEVVPAG